MAFLPKRATPQRRCSKRAKYRAIAVANVAILSDNVTESMMSPRPAAR